MVVHAINPSTWEAEQLDYFEYETSLVYIASSSQARDTCQARIQARHPVSTVTNRALGLPLFRSS